MSRKELSQVAVFRQLKERTITQAKAARGLGLTVRQVKRKWRAYRQRGPASLAHGLRGRPSNRRLDEKLIAQAVELVRTQYPDFGPTFAAKQLAERDGLVVGHDSLRRALIVAGLWRHRSLGNSR